MKHRPPAGKRPRVLRGAYQTDASIAWQLQANFLAAVQEAAPVVVRDLAELLPAYGTTTVDDVAEWAQRWHLDYPWVRRHASETLALWSAHPETVPYGWFIGGAGGWPAMASKDMTLLVTPPGWRPWKEHWLPRVVESNHGPLPVLERVTPEVPTNTVQGWDPTWETKAAAAERIHAAVDAYLDSMAARCLDGGLAPVPDRHMPEHFVWLARRLCLDDPVTAIAKDYLRSVPAVEKAIHGVTLALGMSTPGRGRPPGRKEHHDRRIAHR
jgi:hypothetical protein